MQSRKPILPPSRAVLVLLPLTLIEVLDYASNVLKMHRTDVIRRSLMRDVNSLLREEVSRAQTCSGATRTGQINEDDWQRDWRQASQRSGLVRIADLSQTLRHVR